MALALGAVQVAIVSFIFTTFSIIALALRLWSRRILRLSFVFNDYMAILALALALGAVSVFLAAGFAAGLGVHLDEILATNPKIFALHLKLFVPAQLLWAAANTCVKLSILSLYTTIFPKKRFSYVCYGVMALSIAYFVSVFLETFVLCKPARYNWDKSIPGECNGENSAYLGAGITNLLIDTIIVALPMPMLFGLQMSLPKKLGIAGMFSLGIVICVISLLRVIWLHNWDLSDMTYTVTPGAIYSVLEPTLGVVNACLPTMRPALIRIFGNGSLNWSRKDGLGTNDSSILSNRDRRLARNSKDRYSRNFLRLDDDIPLTNIQAENRQAIDSGQSNVITVIREWDIDRSGPSETDTAHGSAQNLWSTRSST
ncbi:uncharacterized protein F4822DRAFT_356071 [Hypoxylon trugodes]|uniref:uncharacterized protein n=1 Tax=Hypoxylon trugodes TaxID=326681 RepID=UPI00219A33EA|nr:uncharacterized protein F4822DRAFT_356071 [Hypoxylon trugodes]KAI1385850.1 hypothetical protein F4822DRAFT_356071 [Hypoxylon trugodes]